GAEGDLSRDLSTFTAHLSALKWILEAAGPSTLVLIDEIAADTDPREGAAIAAAALEKLVSAGAQVLITTHLEELKALALSDDRFASASVGFDVDKLAPTYRLRMGEVGRSSAIEIAARFGARAELVEDLARRKQQIAEMVAQLQAAPALARAVEAQQQIARLEAEEEREVAREEVRAEDAAAAAGGEIRPGAPVRHARLGVEGTVIEVDEAGALVQIGALRTKVARADLVPLARKPKGDAAGFRKTAREKIARAEAVRAAPASTVIRPLDVRGLRVDEALRALEEELDRRLREGAEEVQVLHGHGSGALKAAIREHLARSPYVRRARAGASHEGGDGVTVAELRG